MEKSNFITSWQEIHTIVDDAMAKATGRLLFIFLQTEACPSVYPLGPMRNRCGSPMSGAKSHTTTIAQNWV